MKKDKTMIQEIKEYIGAEIGELKKDIGTLDKKIDFGIDEAKRHAGVLFEGLRSEVKIIAEQHGDIMRKLEEHDRRFDEVDSRFDKVDMRFNRVDLDLKGMKIALFDNSHRLNDHDARIRKLETR
jgi:chromosome segregation ATPase